MQRSEASEAPSTPVFGAYSRYYDLLYKDKDYAAEAEYVRSLIVKHRPNARSVIDLGCGTGRHAALLAELGYRVIGVDRSEEMLAVARLFTLDCWYGPEVSPGRRAFRVRGLEDDQVAITRVTEPVIDANANCVAVNFHVLIKDKQSGKLEELRETHRMRYLFSTEIALLLEAAGLRLEHSCAFMTDAPLGFDTWSAVFVATVGA